MINLCTLFDSKYICKGIALYLSISKHTDNFCMYVMAMDRECEKRLNQMCFEHMKVECIEDNMTKELMEAHNNRSKAEYCWTCGPFVTHRFLTKYNLADISYIDSDLMFFSSPQVILDELESKGASVGLSPHFIPYNATGNYCVQYCFFKNDKDGLSALTWWKDECLKWCYSIIEDGKYGDQMYLDQMSKMFKNVCDIDNRGAGLAYWNSFAYKFSSNYITYKRIYYPIVYFHYSGFNISWKDNKVIVKECYAVSKSLRKYFVLPYVSLISEVYSKYLGCYVADIDYHHNHSLMNKIINGVFNYFNCWHRLRGYLLTVKYSKRHSPYSEKYNR